MVQITAAVTVQLNKKSTPCTPQGWAKIYARISSHPKYLSKRHYRTICTTVKKKWRKGAKLECTTAKVKGGERLGRGRKRKGTVNKSSRVQSGLCLVQKEVV